MSDLNRVVWAEGVFIGQQHFQTWDRYIQAATHFTMKAHHPFYWGVVSLSWNDMAMREGRFELQKLQCILPSGQVVDYRREQNEPIFMDLHEAGGDDITVCLAIPANGLVEGAAGYSTQSRKGGWIASYLDVADECDSARTREVMVAKPNILLRTDRDTLDQMQVIRLARFQRQYDGGYKSVPEMLPPCLQLNAVPLLFDMLQTTTDMLANLVRDFAKNRMKSGDVSSFSTTELADFLLQNELVLLLNECRQLRRNSHQHPYEFYQVLMKLHQVAASHLHPEKMGDEIEYRHDSMYEPLSQILNDIRTMLSLKKDRPESRIALIALSPGRFESTEIPKHALESYSFYLAVDAKQDSLDWVTRFPGLCKVSALEQIEMIVSSGLPGVQVQHVQRLPQKVRIKSGYEYFQLNTDSDLWSEVLRTQVFGVFCMGEFADADIDLVAVDEN